MKITMIKHPTEEDWMFCKRCTLNTVGKKATTSPNYKWKRKLLESEHSPIRTLWFAFEMEIPYWVSVHYTRHKHGVEHYVQSQRDDRVTNPIPRADKPQGEVVNHIMYVNAQELLFMARRRLCNQASVETRYVMREICRLVLEKNPEFTGLLVPMCVYKGGRCDEFKPCGKWTKLDAPAEDNSK